MTAPIRGLSVSFPAADEVDPQPAVSPPPPRSTEAATNRVDAWSGPRSAPMREDSIGSSSLTAGQLAHGSVPSLTADGIAPELDALMGTGKMLSFPSADDARHAVSLLEQLPPKEYRRALEDADSRTLQTMFTKMDAQTRADFFAQARQKGAIAEEPGVRMPPLVGSPPDKPALLRNDAGLRLPLREAIHAENKARVRDYMHQFDPYTARYAEAAYAAPNPMTLRSMGAPVSEFTLYEPGLVGARDNQQFGTLEQGAATSRARAARAVNDRIADFAGRTRAGSLSLVASAKVTFEAAPIEIQLKREDRLTDAGKHDTAFSGEVLADVAPGASVGVDEKGRAVEQFKAGDFKAKFEDRELTRLEGEVNGFGVQRDEGKTTLLAKVPGTPFGTYATIDEKKGSYGGGFRASEETEIHGLGKIEIEAKLGVQMQGVAPERLGDIASMKDGGIWGPMPELDQRMKWSSISPERQAELKRQCGFNASNWPVR